MQLLFRVVLEPVIQLELMAVVAGQVNSHVVINHFRLLLFTEALRYHELILYKLFRYCDILNLINLIIYYGQKEKTLNNYCLLKSKFPLFNKDKIASIIKVFNKKGRNHKSKVYIFIICSFGYNKKCKSATLKSPLPHRPM